MIVDARRKAVPWPVEAAVYDLDSCRSWSNKDAWRISQNVELPHDQPYGMALVFMTNFGAEHVL
jgi:hypothetical protein